MGIKYTNIKKDNSLDFNTDYITFSKKELLIEFERCAREGGIESVEWFDKKESPYKCRLANDTKVYHLYMYLKNISGAGWENKPWIKRVQVPNIRIQHPEYYVSTSESTTLLIIGYYNYDLNPLLVAWDAYGFVMHSTVRSCYVEVDDLLRGYDEGYFEGECSGQRIWVFKPEYLCHFLDDYISKNTF